MIRRVSLTLNRKKKENILSLQDVDVDQWEQKEREKLLENFV